MEILINILLPVLLLMLQFSLKFFIDRKVNAFNFVLSILEFPLSTIFLSLSFFAAFLMTNKSRLEEGFALFLITVIITVFSVFFWRRAVNHFENEKFLYAFLLGLLNFSISIPLLLYSINILINI